MNHESYNDINHIIIGIGIEIRELELSTIESVILLTMSGKWLTTCPPHKKLFQSMNKNIFSSAEAVIYI